MFFSITLFFQDTAEGHIHWRIENFLTWAAMQGNNSSHISADYSYYSKQANKKFTFNLQIYPRGKKGFGNEGNVCVYLVSNLPEVVGLTGSMCFGNRLEEETFTLPIWRSLCASIRVGRTKLAQEQSTYLPEGHLDIHCRFTVSSYEKKKSRIRAATKTPEPLKESMQRLLSDPTLSDLVINSGNEKFHCHKIILANRYEMSLGIMKTIFY